VSDKYTSGFDEGNGDEACFTLIRDDGLNLHTEVMAFGDTARRLQQAFTAEAERHTCPGCIRFATLLVNADACPLKGLGSGCAEYGPGGCVWHECADEDTADCVARIVAWEEGL
jgi:hypothetical protein